METKFIKLRQELNDLGYTETLKSDSAPLVDRLLSDLKTTTENLKKYMKISQQAIEERDNLRLGAEPYKCDNAKLIRECNDLHLAFIQFKEQHEKVQKDLRTQLRNCELKNQDFKKQIKDLEVELSHIRKGATTATSKTKLTSGKAGGAEKSKSFQLSSAMASAEERISFLSREIKRLKHEHLELAGDNEFFKSQLQNREKEIARLNSLLEGGRPVEAIKHDYSYKNMDNKISALQDDINMLKREKNALHNQLKDALAKQHEAMRRALHLAERNKQLENEMKDIDQIALAVEAECNSTVKNNSEKVTRLQDRLNESVIVIQNLEREASRLKQDKLELSSDLDAIMLEKKHLQSILDMEIEDKKRLTDRINSFTIIEHDLNMEIDRLLRLTGEQKRKMAEMECQITDDRVKSSSFEFQRPVVVTAGYQPSRYANGKTTSSSQSNVREPVKPPGKSKKSVKTKHVTYKKEDKSTFKKSISNTSDAVVADDRDKLPPLMPQGESQVGRCCCEAGSCMKNLRELLDKEMELRQVQAMQQIDSLKQEKEYYMKEYHKMCDELRNIPTQDRPDNLQRQYEDLFKKIEYKDQVIADLQNQLKAFIKERTTLMTQTEGQKDLSDCDPDAPCTKGSCKRRVRELEMIRNDLKHMEKENDSLKRQIQALNESTVFDAERMKQAFQEMEEHIRKLEGERRELVIQQNTNRSNMSLLEEEYNLMKEKLKSTQSELNNQRASYVQLKNLHDQTGRALSESQSQLLKSESELANLGTRISNTGKEVAEYEREKARLQSDIQLMKTQLSKIDEEKDELLNTVDEKTEKNALLEDELKAKKEVIIKSEMELRDLKRKLDKYSDEAASQEQLLRSSRHEIAMLQQDYEKEKKLKESALQENRSLQSDLCSVTCDCKNARKELEIARRQVEDLKRQLQHYVAEVKRTEDLISQKELERSEILDQYKCLSEEANILESSNHTLENEATQSRVQLSVALDHTSDLERKLDNQTAVIRSYEKQISELTRQVACLEIQVKQSNSQYDRISTELNQMKDLCIRLDHEKDTLQNELSNKDDRHGQVERHIDTLSQENDDLRNTLEKERNSIEGLEKLLSEARQEVITQRILNQDLQAEVNRLKNKVEELQEQLATTSDQLDLYQEKALEYSQQIKQLRREIANERFSRAREGGDTKRQTIQKQRFVKDLLPIKSLEARYKKAHPRFEDSKYKLLPNDKPTQSMLTMPPQSTLNLPAHSLITTPASRTRIPKVQRKPYCELCKRTICSPQTSKNGIETDPMSPEKTDPNGKMDQKCIKCRCTVTSPPPRRHSKLPTRDSSGYVPKYPQNRLSIQANSFCCDKCRCKTAVDNLDMENWTQLELAESPDENSQVVQETVDNYNDAKLTNIPSPSEISYDSLRSMKHQEEIDGDCKTFKNVLTVEGPGIECCISRYKVVHAKPPSPS